MSIGARFFFSFSNLISYLACNRNNLKANFRLENKVAFVLSPKKKHSLCLHKISFFSNFSADFSFSRSDLFLFLGIIYSTLCHQFVNISGSVTGCAIFLSSAENYGQTLKCGLDILGFPRIINYVRKLSEPKRGEN